MKVFDKLIQRIMYSPYTIVLTAIFSAGILLYLIDFIEENRPRVVVEKVEEISIPIEVTEPLVFKEEDVDLERQAETECLALNIYHEARGDNYAGKYAVADVVLNRQSNRRYPDKICDVIKQGYTHEDGQPIINRCQFSWYCDGLSDVPKETVAYQEAVSLAQQMMEYQAMRGITEGATHYHAYYVTPDWVNDRGMILIGRIGDHIFYQLH